jgi:hypothetical protein
MTRGSTPVLYVLLGIPAVVLVVVVLLATGPVGWFLAAFLGIAALGVASLFGANAEGAGTDRANCPQCGSRTAADGACDYCGDPL